MTSNEIKAALALNGTTQSAIARKLGVSITSVARVIAKEMRSSRIEAELEKVTGRPTNPEPRKPGGRKKSSWTGVTA